MLMLLLIYLILLIKNGSTKDVVRIGGIFNEIKEDGTTDIEQKQALNAFKLAIDEINADTSLNFEFSYKLESGFGQYGGLQAADKLVSLSNNIGVYGITGVDVVINAGDDDICIGANIVLKDKKVPTILLRGEDQQFGDGDLYPYKMQLSPIETYYGMVFQDIMCEHMQTKADASGNLTPNRRTLYAVFTSSDTYGGKVKVESGDNTYCADEINGVPNDQMDIIYSAFFSADIDDFSAYIKHAIDLEVKIFLVALKSYQTGLFLEQAHSLGLNKEGSQIFILAKSIEQPLTSQQFWQDIGNSATFSDQEKVDKSLLGVIAIVEAKYYHMLNSQAGKAFTAAYLGSTYKANESKPEHIAPLAAYAYDAVYLLKRSVERYRETNPIPITLANSTVNDFMNSTFYLPVFTGATGAIKIFEGMADYGNYARGGREIGHVFEIWNYQAASHDFEVVGIYTVEDKLQECKKVPDVKSAISQYSLKGSYHVCSNFTYNTAGNEIPTSRLPYQDDTYPSTIKIGGIFTIEKAGGSFHRDGGQKLASFLMAINDINNDVTHPGHIPGTKFVYAIRNVYENDFLSSVSAASYLANEAFGGSGVHVVINTADDVAVEVTNKYFIDYEINQIHTNAFDAILGDGNSYPFKQQICPIRTFQGMIWQSIICTYFEYLKYTIFVTDDYEGSKLLIETADGTYCDTSHITEHIVSQYETDFSKQIEVAKAGGATIFLILLPPDATGRLILQGYESKLFHEGTQIFLGELSVASPFWTGPGWSADTIKNMKGVIYDKYAPSYAVRNSESKGADFLIKFKNLPDSLDGTHCKDTVDDDGNFYLYRNHNNTICYGFKFATEFTSPRGVDIHEYAPHAYDAVILLARVIKLMKSNSQPFSGLNLRDALFALDGFDGASGFIKIFEGMAEFGYYARGGREDGYTNIIYNFNFDAYNANQNNPFVKVGLWTPEGGYELCDKSIDDTYGKCYSTVYNTHDNLPAKYQRSDVNLLMHMGPKATLFFLGALTLVMVTAISVVIFMYKDTKIIKACQPGMLYFALLGCTCGGIRTILSGIEPGNGKCVSQIWLGHLAFNITFFALLIKTWRVDRLVNGSGFKRIKISNQYVYNMQMISMIVVIFYLSIWSGVSLPHMHKKWTFVANQYTYEFTCSMEYAEFQTTLMSLETVILFYAIRLCLLTKDLPDAVNESKPIAVNIFIMGMICAIILPVNYLLFLPEVTKELMVGLGFFICTSSTLIFLFGPKVYIVLSGSDIENINGKKKRGHVYAVTGTAKIAATSDYDSNQDLQNISDMSDLILYTKKVMKAGDLDARMRICYQQQALWQRAIVEIAERHTSSSSSSSLTRDKSSNEKESYADMVDPGLMPLEATITTTTTTTTTATTTATAEQKV